MLRTIFFLFFLYSVAYCTDLQLKDKLSEAKPGSYLVIEQNKTFTFLHIHDRGNQSITLEEVSIPAARYANYLAHHPSSWKEWFENGAPGHTSWIMSRINLESGIFEETFSFTHEGWVDMSDSNSFMTTLLNLAFHEVPHSQRRRIGLPPGYNKPDQRPIWNPRLIVEGQLMQGAPFIAYKTRWPADGSELSRKTIEIYVPAEQSWSWCPVYFPYWLEVEGKIGSAKARVIDSGLSAQSPKRGIPSRSHRGLGHVELQMNEEGLTFYFNAPSCYHEFILIAEQDASFFGKTFSLPCESSYNQDQGKMILFIPQKELTNLVSKGETYHFLITPKDNPTLVFETTAQIN